MATSLTLDPGAVPPTVRGRARRERITDAAERLFGADGFHATGIDEIGAAAGITGPGIYRHFDGKDALLLAVLDRVWRILRDGLERAADLDPEEALDALVQAYLALAIEHPGGVLVLVREMRHVPEEYRRLAEANEARIVDAWAGALTAVRPDLTPDRARVATRSLHALILSLAVDANRHVAAEEKRALAEAMVRGAVAAL